MSFYEDPPTTKFDGGNYVTLSSTFFWISNQVQKTNIWIPIVILALGIIGVSVLHFIAYFIGPYKKIDKEMRKSSSMKRNHANQSSDKMSNQDSNNNLSSMNIPKSTTNLIPISDRKPQNHHKNLSKGYYIFFVAIMINLVTFEGKNLKFDLFSFDRKMIN